MRDLVPVLVIWIALVSCQDDSRETPPRSAPAPRFFVEWDPATGKGRIAQVFPDGDRYQLHIHYRYPGYAGGLWIGSMNGSGFLWTPKTPIRGFRSLNLFCAQDESLFDETEGREYDAGWSENFGKGDDGARLQYREGEIVSDGSDGRGVVLRSRNAGGCYEVSRYLFWPSGAAYLVVSTTLRNTCQAPVRFSFWTGEDSWIGRYASAEGDVGWYSGGIVRTETELAGPEFRYGGLYDLGNELLGKTTTPFSNVANFFAPDPTLPQPTAVFFANAFAHRSGDIVPGRPLDDGKLTAFNLGWQGLVLAPGERIKFRYALGRAETGDPGSLPRMPIIPEAHWRFDDVLRAAEGPPPRSGQSRSPLWFRAETIRMEVDPPVMEVSGRYHFRNRGVDPIRTSLYYPFPIDDHHPDPHFLRIHGVPWKRTERGAVWTLAIEPGGDAVVEVRYRQFCFAPEARYILTTTGFWGEPFEAAEYEMRWPAELPGVETSYPGPVLSEGGWSIRKFARAPFLPPRDLLVRWRP